LLSIRPKKGTMTRLLESLREAPPTAGLPPRWADLWPSGAVSLGARAAQYLGIDDVQVECSGTAALVVALSALKRLSARKVVIVPAYTCPLVAIAVAHCGLTLRLCDLAPDGIDMDPNVLASLCDADTLAIVPTHIGGRVADVDTALINARRVGAWVIEDAAQAFGAQRSGIAVGTQGDIGFFSLAVGKGLTTYEGGLLIARDAEMRSALRRCHDEMIPASGVWEFKRCVQLLGYYALYGPRGLVLAYGLPRRRALRASDPVAAVGEDFSLSIPLHRLGAWRQSVGARALPRLREFLGDGASRARTRSARLRAIAGVEVIGDAGDAQGVWPFFLLRMPSEAVRDVVLDRLWSSGLGVSRLFIHALPDYDYLQSIVAPADVPNARAFAARTLTISNSAWLDDVGFAKVCAVLDDVSRRLR
jgi:dTDP-4-amino-4,6-dideoxygalactose transaminase